MRKSIFPVLLVLLLTVSCGEQNKELSQKTEATGLEYGRLLSMRPRPDGAIEVDIRNPWDTVKMLQRLLLVADSLEEFENPEGRQVVRTPLKNALVYSTVHTELISELGGDSAIGGVCESKYISQPALRRRLEDGTLVDCGNSSSPVMEKIIMLRPDAILLSPYANSTDHSSLARLGTTVIECADYMEPSPLGRAEWMKFYGALFGRPEEAENMWKRTRDEYISLSGIAKETPTRPTVLLDRLYSGIWYLPGSSSLWDIYLRDAGAENPFAGKYEGNTLSLSAEQVVADGADADFWLIRYNQPSPLTRESLAAEHPVYPRIKAFREGRVYGSDTSVSGIFEDAPFHPQWLLSELVRVLHPELTDSLPDNGKRYFHPVR